MFLLLLLFLFICSFVLFVASRHDFVLIRQNISIRLIFDKAFIITFFALLVARIFYLIDERLYEFFLDPLSFLHVILYYGFLLLGFFITVALGVVLLYRKRKNLFRILDIYMISFYPLTIFVAIYHLVSGSFDFRIAVGYLVLSLLLFPILIKMHSGYKIKDGIVSFTILILSAISYLGYSFVREKGIALYSPIQIVALVDIAISAYCLVLIRINFFHEK